MQTHVEQERAHFVAAALSGQWTMVELCERFGISRPTGYKWVQRGREAVADQSRAPHQSPQTTPAALVARIVAARQHDGWGATKRLTVLRRQDPMQAWPARSTVNDILDRHQLLTKRRRRGRWQHPGAGPLTTTAPNDVWPADFKGECKTGDGVYGYPLTVTDHFSRRLLACRGLESTAGAPTQRAFRALFREVGVPAAIRTDNGAPFAAARPRRSR